MLITLQKTGKSFGAERVLRDVTAAVDAASETVSTGGLLAAKTVIPSPHPDMIKYLY